MFEKFLFFSTFRYQNLRSRCDLGRALHRPKSQPSMGMFGFNFVFFHFLSSKSAWYVRFRGSVTCAQKADTMGIFFQCVTRSCPTLIFEAPSEHLKWQIQLGIRSFLGVRRAGRNSLKAINILPKVFLSILLLLLI